MYKVNPSVYNGIFVLPVEITDRYLKLVPDSFIKVLLLIYRHGTEITDEKDISAQTGLPISAVEDACNYWQQEGFILSAELSPVIQTQAQPTQQNTIPASDFSEAQTLTPAQKDYMPIKHKKPTYNDICIRIKESAEVRELFTETEARFNRTLSTGDKESLLDLYDFYGLPISLILSLCEYAVKHEKGTNTNYVYTVGINWSKRGINTIEAADEEFKKLENLNIVWAEFCKTTGFRREAPTQIQEKYINKWTYEWHFSVSMLVKAFEEMNRYAEKSGFPYMHKILENWQKNNIKTPDAANAFQEDFRKKQDETLAKKSIRGGFSSGAAKQAPNSAPSYDIDKATQLANAQVPVLKKKH